LFQRFDFETFRTPYITVSQAYLVLSVVNLK